MPPSPIPYLLALGLVGLDVVLRAVRLRVLLPRAGRIRLWDAVAVNAYGDAASAVTPARLGGEAARFVALRRADVAAPTAVVVLGVERVIDLGLIAVVTLAAASTLGGRGFRDVSELLRRFTTEAALPWVVAVGVLLLVAGGVAYHLRRRVPPSVAHSIGQAVRDVRRLSSGTLLAAGALTLLVTAARITVLPVLLWSIVPVQDPVAVLLGSFALVYSQLLLPTPAGAGGVELGFVLGLAPTLAAAQIASLLVVWRVYTLGIPAGLGAVLLLRGTLKARAPA
jgi:uncharacterized membrane protein YbhN (UPF0104 family)